MSREKLLLAIHKVFAPQMFRDRNEKESVRMGCQAASTPRDGCMHSKQALSQVWAGDAGRQGRPVQLSTLERTEICTPERAHVMHDPKMLKRSAHKLCEKKTKHQSMATTASAPLLCWATALQHCATADARHCGNRKSRQEVHLTNLHCRKQRDTSKGRQRGNLQPTELHRKNLSACSNR